MSKFIKLVYKSGTKGLINTNLISMVDSNKIYMGLPGKAYVRNCWDIEELISAILDDREFSVLEERNKHESND